MNIIYIAPTENRTRAANETCGLLERFAEHLFKGRTSMGKEMFDRLMSYVNRSAKFTRLENDHRVRQDVSTKKRSMDTIVTMRTAEWHDSPPWLYGAHVRIFAKAIQTSYGARRAGGQRC